MFNDTEFRTWGQGGKLITVILLEPCTVCTNTTWVMTDRAKGSAVYECLHCRTVMEVVVKHTVHPKMNEGKPLPESKDSEQFYQQFTADHAEKMVDTVAGSTGKCFICGIDHGMSGALSEAKVNIVGLVSSQVTSKEVKVLCCEMCVASLRHMVIVQCGSVGCANWKWQPRQAYSEENKYKFAHPEIISAFEEGDIVFSEHWLCDTCMGIKIPNTTNGWVV